MDYGGKANTLTLLKKNDFRVPPFFALTHDEVKKILSLPYEKEIFLKKFNAWKESYAVTDVAVRSSANVEDSKEQSFAGQFHTELTVSGNDELLKAVRAVYESRPPGIKDHTILVNVIIQKMIHPDFSGVLFTADPTGISEHMIVNVAPGLGEGVVGGQECDQYYIDSHSKKIGIITELEIFKTHISHAHLLSLAQTARAIVEIFNGPQDIEWALFNNEIYILQARPITGLADIRVWDSSNLSESYPGITLPLTFSVVKNGYAKLYMSQAKTSGISKKEIERYQNTFETMLGIFGGKMYYNLYSWYEYMTLFPNPKRNRIFFDQMIGTSGAIAHPSIPKRTIFFKIKYFTRILWRVIFFSSEIKAFYKRMNIHFSHVNSTIKKNNAYAIMERYTYLEKNVLPYYSTTIDNDFLAMTYNGVVTKLVSKWIPNIPPHEITALISGIRHVESAEQAIALESVAKKFFSDSSLKILLEEKKFKEALNYIENTPLTKLIEEYQERFGNRYALDLKIEVPNTLMDPEELLKIIRTYGMRGSDILEKGAEQSALSAQKNTKEILDQLPFHKQVILKHLTKRLKSHIREREKMRLMRSKLFQIFRSIFSDLGTYFVDKGMLEKKEDLFYLEIDEIKEYLSGTLASGAFMPLVTARRGEYEVFNKITRHPDKFVTRGIPKLATIIPTETDTGELLKGIPSSPGLIRGRAVVMNEPIIPDAPIEILVVKHTDPGWTPILALCKGVIVEKGGMLSHAAIITRELGIPSIIGVSGATRTISTGDMITLDANNGIAKIETT